MNLELERKRRQFLERVGALFKKIDVRGTASPATSLDLLSHRQLQKYTKKASPKMIKPKG